MGSGRHDRLCSRLCRTQPCEFSGRGSHSALANVSPGEAAHRFPFFLPDGRHFLYQQGSAIFVTALDSGELKFEWVDDAGERGDAAATLRVTG